MNNTYDEAGVISVKDFYKSKFAFQSNFDFTNRPIQYYNASYYKMLWIYSNVKPNTRVLDFGCGSGTLSCLKAAKCEITGIDYSKSALDIAKNTNKYDYTYCGSIFEFEHEEAYFDYIVSLDVFGHIEFKEKDRTIKQLKKFLKPSGTMLHGIECGNVDYQSMTNEQFAEYVNVDGHIGVEGRIENISRFKQFFNYVEADLRYDCVYSISEIIRQKELYNASFISEKLFSYLKTFDSDEIEISDIANGFVLRLMHDNNLPSNNSNGGFLFLSASEKPIVRVNIKVPCNDLQLTNSNLIYSESMFLRGWFDIEYQNEKAFRWAKRNAFIILDGCKDAEVVLEIVAGNPNVSKNSTNNVYIIDNDTNEIINNVVLTHSSIVKLVTVKPKKDKLCMKLYSETTFVPKYSFKSEDTRELGFMLTGINFD